MDTLRQRIQKAIPTVYDESLSYYEVLQKVIEAVQSIHDYIEGIDKNIELVCEELLTTYIADGSLHIDATYTESDESLSLVFSKENGVVNNG